jgi:hypothetical protein
MRDYDEDAESFEPNRRKHDAASKVNSGKVKKARNTASNRRKRHERSGKSKGHAWKVGRSTEQEKRERG